MTLQENNVSIDTNNSELSSILNIINNLPTGGGTDNRWLQVLEGTITEIRSTEMTVLRVYCLYGCGDLTTLDLPNVTRSGSYSCRGCSALVNVNLPNISTLGSGMFHTCTSLQTIDLPNVTSIGTNMFYGCTNLKTIILRRTSLVSLGNVSAFADMPVESGTGYIYVPDNLVDSYKGATNWSTYANQILPLSSLEDDGGIGGGGAP